MSIMMNNNENTGLTTLFTIDEKRGQSSPWVELDDGRREELKM